MPDTQKFGITLINMLKKTIIAAAMVMFATHIGADVYRLSSGDVIQVSLPEHEKVNGAYPIGPEGQISIPGIGVVTANGLTIQELEEALKQRAAATILAPSISVSILQYRPIYILGDVSEAGKYDFIPGLTVMQAIALAKGLGRLEQGDEFSRLLTGLRTRGALNTAKTDLISNQIKLSRITAEYEGKRQFSPAMTDLPEGLEAWAKSVISHETAQMAARWNSFDLRQEKLRNALSARHSETASYAAQIATQDELLKEIQAELEKMRDLQGRGLVSNERLGQLTRQEISTRSQIQQIVSLKLRSEVEMRNAENQLNALTDGRALSLLQTIGDLKETIKRLEDQIRADQAIIRHAENSHDLTGRANIHRFELYRDNRLVPTDTTLTTKLEPGDTLFIIRTDLK